MITLKNFVDVATWAGNYKINRPNERMGQAFCNEFSTQSEDLFYTEDNYEALCIIHELVLDAVGEDTYYQV